MSESTGRLRSVASFWAGAALLLALGALGYAYFAFLLLCDENCAERNWQLNLQLGVAGIIVAVALGMICCVILEWGAALVALTVLTCLLYFSWILLLLDAGPASAR